ncbi:hypothetical protein DVH05_025515 [Phytophthora capsici]|nr:hypothetical protein DVH05_025515 [Phytophthora capsici]
MEQDERRSAKRKSRETGRKRKSVVTPANFQLQTELLAEKRKQQREEKEVAQLRHVQQKIMGNKTVEDFAQLKLIRRQSAAERNQSLHCNGKTLNVVMRGKERDHRDAKDRSTGGYM